MLADARVQQALKALSPSVLPAEATPLSQFAVSTTAAPSALNTSLIVDTLASDAALQKATQLDRTSLSSLLSQAWSYETVKAEGARSPAFVIVRGLTIRLHSRIVSLAVPFGRTSVPIALQPLAIARRQYPAPLFRPRLAAVFPPRQPSAARHEQRRWRVPLSLSPLALPFRNDHYCRQQLPRDRRTADALACRLASRLRRGWAHERKVERGSERSEQRWDGGRAGEAAHEPRDA